MNLVLTVSEDQEMSLPNGSQLEFNNTQFFKILFGGDQLTAARICGIQSLQSSEDKATDMLEGLIPVIEDWHARINQKV